MSLFRRFFYRRPPDGLLEITERVYVFDSCFSTDVFEDDTYKIYMRQIATHLHEQFPDSSFLVFNFREGEKKSQLTEILSQFDMTVMDYPRQYEGCPILSMEMIHHFLRSSDSWLSLEGHQNIMLMHCERGGWPLLAFVLSCFLIYRKFHTGEQRTLDMLHREAPKGLLQLLSPLNPTPSQLRYLQYVARRNNSPEWPPPERALTLDCLMLRVVPSFDSAGGCRPLVRIYGREVHNKKTRSTQVLFSLGKKNKLVRHYRQVDCDIVKIDVQCSVQGDVVLECIHLENGSDREEMMFRVMFNTAFIRSNILILTRDDIDILWNAKERFTKDFRAEVLFGEVDTMPSRAVALATLVGDEKGGLPIEAFARVQELFNSGTWDDGQGDAALRFLQQQFANGFQEKSEKSPLGDMNNGQPLSSRGAEPFQPILLPPLSPPFRNSGALMSVATPLSSLPSRTAVLQESPSQPPPPSYLPSLPPFQPSPRAIGGTTLYPQPLPCSSIGALPPPAAPLPPPLLCRQILAPRPPPPPPPPPLSRLNPSSSRPPPPPPTALPHSAGPPPSPPSPPSLPPRRSSCPPPPPPPPFSKRSNAPSPPPAPPLPPRFPGRSLGAAPPPTPLLPQLLPGRSIGTLPPPPPLLGRLSATPPPPPPPPPPPKPAGSIAAPPTPSGIRVRSTPHPPPASEEIFSGRALHPPPALPGERGGLLVPSSPAVSKGLGGPPPPPPPPSGRGRGATTAPSQRPCGSSNRGISSTLPSPPNFPAAPPMPLKKTSLKPLHWVKVTRAVQGSLWAESQRQEETKGPEFDMKELESLFSNAALPATIAGDKGGGSRSTSAHKQEKIHLIDLRRANNCEIMLTKIKMPMQDMLNAILNMDGSVLDMDQIENLIKFSPTKDEMDMLKGFVGDKEVLGKAEQFFLELMRVPRIEAKLRVFSFRISFVTQVAELRESLVAVNEASREVRESVKLRCVMRTILSLGNALNQGTARGSAIGFKLDSLLKLTDTRARNNKMTLMHYLCKVVGEKLSELLDFHKDLTHLEGASKIQLKMMAEEMQAVSKGLEKVEQELTTSENDGPISESFRKVSKTFLDTAEAEVRSLASLYSEVGRNADALARYFGEDPARCSFEQVTSILLNFVLAFKRAHEDNAKQAEFERKKVEKDAEKERMRNSPAKRDEEIASFHPNFKSRVG